MTESASDWDSSYRGEDPPPWDIGRPQPAFIALANQGRLAGDLLDAGCGTGEHALLAASAGARVTGVDLSEAAVRAAKAKAAERNLTADFLVGDLLSMQLPQHGYDIVLDSGLFHVFDDENRTRYVAALARLLRPGGACHLMCFSDQQSGDWGPRRVTQREIEQAFAAGWTIAMLERDRFDVNPIFGLTTAEAWLAEIRRA